MDKKREEFIRDLYFKQRKSYHEIAKEARVSLRDIKGVLDRGTQGTQEKQTQSKRAQAYEMFSKGETPMTVAITLDLPEPR